jgi:hypothetical protein
MRKAMKHLHEESLRAKGLEARSSHRVAELTRVAKDKQAEWLRQKMKDEEAEAVEAAKEAKRAQERKESERQSRMAKAAANAVRKAEAKVAEAEFHSRVEAKRIQGNVLVRTSGPGPSRAGSGGQ